MRKIFILVFVLSLLVSMSQAKEDKFDMTTVDEKTIQVVGAPNGLILKGYEGKIVLLEFFGHKCPPCLESIRHYKDLQEKYKDKLAVIGIEVQGLDESALREFVKEKAINYTTITQEGAGQLIPYIGTRAQWSGSIPYLIILDQNGDVQLMQAGMLEDQGLENLVKELIK
jgi:thiol-disulfide isomerase/thioredoxin